MLRYRVTCTLFSKPDQSFDSVLAEHVLQTGIQGNTREYRGIQGDTGEYKGIQENTREYKGIQGNTGEYRVIPTINQSRLVECLVTYVNNQAARLEDWNFQMNSWLSVNLQRSLQQF